MARHRVLVVDDSLNTLTVLRGILADDGYDVTTAQNAEQAEQLFREGPHFDVVLSDLKMRKVDGLQLYHHLRSLDNRLIFIIMTAFGTIESSVKSMKEGVYDYLVKPINFDELSLKLAKAVRERQQVDELEALRDEVSKRHGLQNIVGQSAAMEEVFDLVRAVAPTDVTVLVTGETGTGKELITRAIHYLSPRHNQSLICINCAALSESLLEAELFGYVRGAFTGAARDHMGRLEAADGGTLFLDEVGEMSPALQAKMLRFLQERTFERVGTVNSRMVDVRVIAATNRDLEREVEERNFLPDLYYRLQVIHIPVPPLRSRKEDIPLLADHFLRAASARFGKPSFQIHPDVTKALSNYRYPGNVRELSNLISRLVILKSGGQITLNDLPLYMRDAVNSKDEDPLGLINRLPGRGITLKELERELITKTLELFDGHRSLTAKALGISRKSLYERMRRFHLD